MGYRSNFQGGCTIGNQISMYGAYSGEELYSISASLYATCNGHGSCVNMLANNISLEITTTTSGEIHCAGTASCVNTSMAVSSTVD